MPNINKLREYQYANGFKLDELSSQLKCCKAYLCIILNRRKQPGKALRYRIEKLLESWDQHVNGDKTAQQKQKQCEINQETQPELQIVPKTSDKLPKKIVHNTPKT